MNRALKRKQKKLAQKGTSFGGHEEFGALLQRGIEFQQSGELPSAEQCYRKILTTFPNHPEANHLLGTLAYQIGQHEAAIPYLEKAVGPNTTNPNFHNMAGLAYKAAGQFEKAEQAHKAATAIDPNFAAGYNSLAILYSEQEQFELAIGAASKALKSNKNMVEAYNTLGNIYERQQNYEKAIEVFEQGLAINPGHQLMRYNMARAIQNTDDKQRALDIYEGILAQNPKFAEAYSNYAHVLSEVGRAHDAVEPLQKAAELEPTSSVYYYNLGLALAKIGRAQDAAMCFEGAFKIDPEYAYAYNDHGNAILSMGNAYAAIPSYKNAAELAPNSSSIHNNLGNAYLRAGKLAEAKSAIERAIELKDDFADAFNNLGVLHQELGEFDEAKTMFSNALRNDPSYRQANSNMLFTMNYDPSKTGEEIFEEYKAFNARFAEPLRSEQKPHTNSADPNRRIRVGYVAPTFYKHAVGFHLMPLFELNNREDFEIFAYAGLSKGDEYTEQYRVNCDQFIITTGMSEEAIAERIRADEIDIIVDIAGHANGSKLGVFARKPAPISLHWLDFGYTTGMNAIDYYLGDKNVTPVGQDHLFGEKEVWRLDGPSVVYRPGTSMGEVGPLPAKKNGFITFCTLSRTVRLNRKTIRVWAEILKRIPNAKLRADSRNFDDPGMCDNLAARFAEFGIGPERLIMGFNSPPWDVLREIDIALDCFPHNSGTTLFEHLYMGNPFVTLYNRASVGTLGGAILRGGGFDDWVAQTEEEYIDIAVALASDIDALENTRRTMRDKMKASPLMDERAFVDRVEGAYRQMWQKWCAQQ